MVGLLFAFESMCAILAWTFVEELDHERLEAKQKQRQLQMKQQKKPKVTRRKANKAPGWGVVSQSLDKITALSEPVVEKAEHEVSSLAFRQRSGWQSTCLHGACCQLS